MIDSDDVLMFRPALPAAGLAAASERVDSTGGPSRTGPFLFTVYPLPEDADPASFARFFEHRVAPALVAAGADIRAVYEGVPSPALPVREGDNVVVSVATFPDPAARARHLSGLDASEKWRKTISPALMERLDRGPEVARLVPTDRSRLRQ